MAAVTDRRVIDAHHHLWDLSARPQTWIEGTYLAPLNRSFLLPELERAARAAGVEATVVVQTVCVPHETPELLALARHSSLVAGVVGWVDLTAPGVAGALRALRDAPGGEKLVGIRHQVQLETDPRWLLRPQVRRGLLAVADAGLPFDLVVTPRQLAVATWVAAGLTGCTFVLDHLGKPPIASGALRPWADDVRRLAALPHTVCKLSGMLTEATRGAWTRDELRPYAQVVMDAFGADRLLFGSDWPVSTLEAGYAEVLGVTEDLVGSLSPSEQDAVFYRNACRVYGLAPA
ncbi:amidohydrolase family protein [Streptomyces sp. NPDC051582]|uniref:amidohydrolase family protein n=1 Tax=Streptomyces sp. NPDC051582 TaxID=3155167 RepID=UPI00344057D9